ncbi:MAG: hypothetical protein Q6373_014755 [Candidatus Sigynarchaeota archaeon]
MADFVVYREVNLLYYLLFLAYTSFFLIRVFPRRKKQPFRNAFIIFLTTSAVLTAMEFIGTIAGIRVFYFGNEVNVSFQLVLQVIMGVGEGGTATGIIYLMVEAIHEKNLKKYGLYMLSLIILMLAFASFTWLHRIFGS